MSKIDNFFCRGLVREPTVGETRHIIDSTDNVLSPEDLKEFFATVGEFYDSPDLSSGSVLVCDGVWCREPTGDLWRFWRYLDD